MEDHAGFVDALATKNQRWIDGARGLSLRVVAELLEWTGRQMDAYYDSMDLHGEGRVSWAGDGPVPLWFDIAQDLTERWVHQMQMREAVGRVEDYAQRYLPTVLRTFVWALPHQFHVESPCRHDCADRPHVRWRVDADLRGERPLGLAARVSPQSRPRQSRSTTPRDGAGSPVRRCRPPG